MDGVFLATGPGRMAVPILQDREMKDRHPHEASDALDEMGYPEDTLLALGAKRNQLVNAPVR
jgi:hypothetical protein